MKKLLPSYIIDNVADLGENFYSKHNIKAVIFDIDNTLVCHKEMTPPENVIEYFEFLKSIGIKYAIVSNNNKERVSSFCRNLDIPYYYKALKPRKKYLKKALNDLGEKRENTLLVGDQLFTDIYGANKMGFLSVMVNALGEDETSFVSFKRKFEKKILHKHKNSIKKWKE